MPSFNLAILEAVFASDSYNENAFENSHYRALESMLNTACDKFESVLPEELKKGFAAIRELVIAINWESRDVGKAIGISLTRDLFHLFPAPNVALEAFGQTYIKPEQTYDSEFQDIEASIANYLKSQKGANK